MRKIEEEDCDDKEKERRKKAIRIYKYIGEMARSIKFNVKVLSYTRSSFERQIMESVVIQQERKHHLLNSKAEYNRSAVPRLSTRLGEKQYKRWEKENAADEEEEKKN